MAGGEQDPGHERETSAVVGGRLRRQLAVMVRSIGWSYAIYWCCNGAVRPQPRRGTEVLEWRDGYYNGDIRTRRTTHPPDDDGLRPDQWGLRRTTQLTELYRSLAAAAEGNDGGRPAPAASLQLSPEDLTHSEWYFLVCMSFTFANGQGLPGRALSCGKEIWVCNAQLADTRVFSRSLLAKSASIQTIVCSPFMGGVLELGTTEHVSENQDLIKRLTSSFSELPPLSVCSGPSKSGSQRVDEEEGQLAPSSVDIARGTRCAILQSEENRIRHDILSGMEDGYVWSENNSLQPSGSAYAMHSRASSDFTAWKMNSVDAGQREQPGTGSQQKMLKKILSNNYSGPYVRNDVGNLDALDRGDNDNNYVGLSGRYGWTSTMKRSELVKEKFAVLKSLVPSLNEADKASVIEDTLDYIKTLEGRVEELESWRGASTAERVDQKGRRDHTASEKTSDNCGGTHERAAAVERHCATILSRQQGRCCSSADISVSLLAGGREVVVEMCCPWRESLLLDIIDAIGGVHLDAHSMQSSTVDGCLHLTIKSMLQGPAPVSPRTIKEALCRVVAMC